MKKDRPGDGPLQPVSVQTTANVAWGLKDKVGVFRERERVWKTNYLLQGRGTTIRIL